MTERIERIRTNSSGILAFIWLACFCVCLLVPSVMRFESSIEADTLLASLGSVSDAYSANLAVILGFYFHSKLKSEKGGTRSISSFWVALVATLIWNALAVGAYVAALLNLTAIDEATKIVSTVAPRLSWLVAPMLGYYFAAPGGNSQRSRATSH